MVHPTEWLDDVRAKLAELLKRNRCDGLPEVCDVEPINNGSYKTVIRALGATCWNTGPISPKTLPHLQPSDDGDLALFWGT